MSNIAPSPARKIVSWPGDETERHLLCTSRNYQKLVFAHALGAQDSWSDYE
jgi:hypothetical protein